MSSVVRAALIQTTGLQPLEAMLDRQTSFCGRLPERALRLLLARARHRAVLLSDRKPKVV